MKLKEFKEIRGTIECLTGLKIGGTKDAVGIGETDNPIIRNPITRLPYIPGSSLKGKLRCLLEMKYADDSMRDGKPTRGEGSKEAGYIVKLFGNGDPSGGTEPTRLIFRDALLAEESNEQLQKALPGSFVEVKTEVMMDRKKGSVYRGALNQQERVPEGTIFDFDMTIRIFDTDISLCRKLFDLMAEAFEMLEQDYLGGNGSRGYGQVAVYHEDGGPMAEYFKQLDCSE